MEDEELEELENTLLRLKNQPTDGPEGPPWISMSFVTRIIVLIREYRDLQAELESRKLSQFLG